MGQRQDRRHDSEQDDGQRTPWQRDRDAVLYSSAFRRLAGVTQVVSPDGTQVFHNRLTHTLEVAQIAQRLAQHFARTADCEAVGGIDPDVVETAALAHDLGHPPFGHIAEKELNRQLLKRDIVCGYEGNAQSFRVISKLSVRSDTSPGLNLTRASLNGSLKYPWPQDEDAPASTPPHEERLAKRQKHKKWGCYRSEWEDFEFARALSAGQVGLQSVEAEIMDWADDIAYSIHDTEDFYRAGLIPLGHLATNPDAVDGLLEKIFSRWEQKGIVPGFSLSDLAGTFRELCNALPFSGPYEPTREQRARVRGFTSEFIGRYVAGTSLESTRDRQGAYLRVDDQFRMQVVMLKELAWQYVIKGRSLAGVQHGQRHALRKLFSFFAEAAHNEDDWAILPARNRDELECLKRDRGNSLSEGDRLRVVADTIAGMTDQQAILMYHRLTGTSAGSMLDSIVI